MLKELLAKRDSILETFRNAVTSLQEINAAIVNRTEEITKQIAELNQESSSLNNLKTENATSIKNLNKILGK